MEEVSKLRLEWARREGGGGRTPRDFLDIVVDGRPLSELVGDQVTCLGWFSPEENAKAVRRLLLKESADLPDGRRTLYVCPECGDIACGAVSLVVERAVDRIVWRDFGYENGYEGIIHTEGLEGIGPFTFDRAEYEGALRRAFDPNAI